VIKKTFKKTGLSFWITTNAAVNFTLFRGGPNFMDLTKAAEVKTSNSGTQKFEWSSFPDNEYLWVQMSSRADEAYAEFQTYGIIDKIVTPQAPPPVVTPGTPGSPPATPSNSTTTASSSAKPNLALIIGIVVGTLGFVGVIGFLIYYMI
jgi:hypothetical protein